LIKSTSSCGGGQNLEFRNNLNLRFTALNMLNSVGKTRINGLADHGLQYESGLELHLPVAFNCSLTHVFLAWRNEQQMRPPITLFI